MPSVSLPTSKLADVGIYLHLAQILGDYRQCGALERGGDRLTDVHVARNWLKPSIGGDDVGVVAIDLGLIEACLRGLQITLVGTLSELSLES